MAGFWEAAAPWLFGVAGLVTFSLVSGLVAPQRTLRAYFGETTDAPGLLAIIRHWGAGVAACGGLLVAAAFLPGLRVPAAVFAIVTKVVFVAAVLGPGRAAAQRLARLAAGFDLVVVVLLAGYLLAALGSG